jgi:hypothetical protein
VTCTTSATTAAMYNPNMWFRPLSVSAESTRFLFYVEPIRTKRRLLRGLPGVSTALQIAREAAAGTIGSVLRRLPSGQSDGERPEKHLDLTVVLFVERAINDLDHGSLLVQRPCFESW